MTLSLFFMSDNAPWCIYVLFPKMQNYVSRKPYNGYISRCGARLDANPRPNTY
jgi:hypothetical protein